ncbi:MAG: alkaline phosphatase family protein [Cyclobacteriaceae bacterium]
MLTGFVDRRIRSNDPIENPNYTVLEFIHRQPGFENKVAAFATWEVFPFILREETSAIPVYVANELIKSAIPVSIPGDEEPGVHDYSTIGDSVTFYSALSFLKSRMPRVLFIGFDGTDHQAHVGDYGKYLSAAHHADEMISRLWTWLQSQLSYKDQTALVVTTDHGRGKGHRGSWKNHGRLAFGSGQAWFAVIGPGTRAYGEMKNEARYSLGQVAKTAAAVLGLDYYNVKPVGDAIETMYEPGLPGAFPSERASGKLQTLLQE